MQDSTVPSTRPYLIRALHEWCTDHGFTPYVVVKVDASVRVPREYVNDGEVVLNISYDATSALQLTDDCIELKARFGGKPQVVYIPMGRVSAIYARENGQGMAFPVVDAPPPAPVFVQVVDGDAPAATIAPAPRKGQPPVLKRIK